MNLILFISVISSAQVEYSWDRIGQCLLKDESGTIIKNEQDLDKCRESEGSSYYFDRMGNCHEWTPDGAPITGPIEERFCRIKYRN